MNHTEPSEATTTSLGALSGLPSNWSISTAIEPSCSVLVTRRVTRSQETRRPWRSRVWPLAWLEGLRNTVTAPVASSQHSIRLLGMSLQSRQWQSPNQTDPSAQR